MDYDSVDSDMRKYALKTHPGIMYYRHSAGWNERYSHTDKELNALAWYILEREFGIHRERPMSENPPENDWQLYMQTKGYTERAKKWLLFWIMKDKIRWHNKGELAPFESQR